MILIYKRQMTIFEAYLPFAPSTQAFPGKILFCRRGRKTVPFRPTKKPGRAGLFENAPGKEAGNLVPEEASILSIMYLKYTHYFCD